MLVLRALGAALLLGGALPSALAGDAKDFSRFNLISAPKLAVPPKVDGVVDKREWYGASMVPRLLLAGKGTAAEMRTRLWLCHDANALYLAFQAERPPNGLVPHPEDLVRLALDAAHAHKALVALSGNAESKTTEPSGVAWQFKARATGFGWEGEISVPFASLGRKEPVEGETWGFDFVNHQMTPVEEVSGWSVSSKKEASAAELSHLRFTKSAPPVRFEQIGPFWSEQGGGAVLELVNPVDQPAQVAVALELLKRKAEAPGSYLGNVAGGHKDGFDIVLASTEELVKEEMARHAPLPKASREETVTVPPQRRIPFRAAVEEAGTYLLKFRVARGEEVLAGGVFPFVMAPPIQLVVTPYHLSPGVVEARAKFGKAKEWDKGAKVRFTLAKKAGDKELARVEREFDGARELAVQLPTRDLAPGGYVASLDLVGPDGKPAGSLSSSFQKRPVPSWFSHPAGLSPAVPYPWKPIQQEGAKLSFLTGDYQLGAMGLPSQVNVASVHDAKRVPLLGGPVALVGSVGGKEIAWEGKAPKVARKSDERVDFEGEGTFGGLVVRAKTEFEYDGVAKVTLRLAPAAGQKPAVDRLSLEFPLRGEAATLYQRSPKLDGMGTFFVAGLVPKEGLKHEFVHSVWLGDEERGFRWFAENVRGWRLGAKPAAEAIEVVREAGGVKLRVNLVRDEKPFAIEKEREIVFGYMFTPARTIPVRPLNHGFMADPAQMPGTKGSLLNSVEPWFFSWEFKGIQSWGWPRSSPAPGKFEDDQRVVKSAQEYGRRVAPYSGWYLPYDSEEALAFGDEMVATPLRGGGCASSLCCWNTSTTDAFVGLMADRVKDLGIDGFRMDAGFSAESCDNPNHAGYGSVCGWTDDAGKPQASRGLFAARRAAQRMYRIYHDGKRKDEEQVCLHHIHQGNRYDFVLDHMDGVVSAEGAETHISAVKELPLDFYRANVMGDAHGYQVSYMPKTAAFGYDFKYGIALLHNIQPRGSHGILAILENSYSRSAVAVTAVWAARDWIGPWDKGTELWGYWKNAKYLDTGDPGVKGTFYARRGEKLLLAVLNVERKSVDLNVRLDLKALGFAGKVYAYDTIAREDVPVNGDRIPLQVNPEGFRMVLLSAKPFRPFVPEPVGDNLAPDCDPAKWPKEGAPPGWNVVTQLDKRNPLPTTTAQLRGEDGAIVIEGDGTNTVSLQKNIPFTPGKSYMLDAEVRVECADGVFLGPRSDACFFRISLGEYYDNDKRSIDSQMPPGRYQKVRLCYTPKKDALCIRMYLQQGKGKAIVRKLAVYELKEPPRHPWIVDN
jgi:hypothetical protein